PATDRDALSPRTLDEREEIHSGPDVPVLDISTFPKGARAGNFFHDILEFVDYRPEGAPERDAMVTSKLQTYGFDAKWKTMVSEALENILASSLPLADGSMRLSELDREHRINELAFHFPISRLTPSLMQNVFGRHPHGTGLDNFSESLGRLMFSPTQGFLKGYIDLVFIHDDRFYIVDWKTNHLGHHPNAYAGNRLAGVMHDELYILQYHLYSLALHRYLGQRIVDYAYDAHFGGVFYLFLRGMRSNAEKFPGIYFDRPPRELIKELENTILIKT
ncbi:MAG: exodeoxyribonuclease V subunit beta, partial [Desulfobacteraceae bacterium]|nr:exodeoxyribonuclease V subunit beta [Desulfobacteraceae bacterium]